MKSILLERPHAVVRLHDLPGGGIPLVFLHGLGCAASCDYPGVVRHPRLAHRRVVLIDLLGSGFSDQPADFEYTIEAHAQVVSSTLDALSIDELDLFGHSMGGAVAIETATILGGRVRHLLLSEPNLDSGGGAFSRALAAMSEADYIERGHAQAILDASSAGNHVWSGSMASTAAWAAHRAAVSLMLGGSPSWRTQLLAHPARRTVIFGAHSLPDPDFANLPANGVSVAVVAEAGHSMAWENPSGLAIAIAVACE